MVGDSILLCSKRPWLILLEVCRLRFVSLWHGRPRLDVKVLNLDKIVTLCNLMSFVIYSCIMWRYMIFSYCLSGVIELWLVMWRFYYDCIFLSYGKERKIKISYSLICQKGKIYRYFEMSFSCFRPFGVWGVTSTIPLFIFLYMIVILL